MGSRNRGKKRNNGQKCKTSNASGGEGIEQVPGQVGEVALSCLSSTWPLQQPELQSDVMPEVEPAIEGNDQGPVDGAPVMPGPKPAQDPALEPQPLLVLDAPAESQQKSKKMKNFFSMIGGFFGLNHISLGRDKQAAALHRPPLATLMQEPIQPKVRQPEVEPTIENNGQDPVGAMSGQKSAENKAIDVNGKNLLGGAPVMPKPAGDLAMERQPLLVPGAPAMSEQKSKKMAYFLWMIGGVFGVHHIYLGRDNQAIATWLTFGVDSIRDLWRIPSYVAEANKKSKIDETEKPKFGTSGFIWAVIVSGILGRLAHAAIPYELIDPVDESRLHPLSIWINSIIVPFSIACGVYIVGNTDRFRGNFRDALIGALLTSPIYHYFQFDSDYRVYLTSILSTTAFVTCSLDWNRQSIPTRLTRRRVGTLLLAGLIISSLWVSWFYFNCAIPDKTDTNNENVIKCRDGVRNYFSSPAWLNSKLVLNNLWDYTAVHGFDGLWDEIVKTLDLHGKDNALKVFNLTDTEATPERITATYRSLAKEWHPDRHHDPEDKARAQDMFTAIGKAYEVLKKIRFKRS